MNKSSIMATRKYLAEKYEVKTIPAVVVLDKGQKVRTLECSMDKAELEVTNRIIN